MKPKFMILVGAKCLACDPHGLGARTGTYYGKTYDLPRWKRKPKCVNCKTRMTRLWEIKVPMEEGI
jgi:hypothetical protein